jgi:hypothetical protein
MAARWQMVGSGRVRCLADADVDIAVQLLECSLDLIKSGCVVEPEQTVYLLPMPVEAPRELGAGDAGLLHGRIKLRLERGQQRQAHPRPFVALPLCRP